MSNIRYLHFCIMALAVSLVSCAPAPKKAIGNTVLVEFRQPNEEEAKTRYELHIDAKGGMYDYLGAVVAGDKLSKYLTGCDILILKAKYPSETSLLTASESIGKITRVLNEQKLNCKIIFDFNANQK